MVSGFFESGLGELYLQKQITPSGHCCCDHDGAPSMGLMARVASFQVGLQRSPRIIMDLQTPEDSLPGETDCFERWVYVSLYSAEVLPLLP